MKSLSIEEKLQRIAKRYAEISYNEDNYYQGGGLMNNKFASVRHEDAKHDGGKITLGEANSLFSKATGLDGTLIKDIILFKFSNLEWHHAGKLPKAYGGGMKKTYFMNSKEVVEFAENFAEIRIKFELDKIAKANFATEQKNLLIRRNDFLNNNAVKEVRKSPSFFDGKYCVTICYEMLGKHGWFESNSRYNLPEYRTAWIFESAEKKEEFLNIK